MIFRQLFDRDSCTYTYLLACPGTREAVIIDPVFELHARDRALLQELGLTLRFALDTHVHADHVTGAWRLKQATGARIGLGHRAGALGPDVALRHDEVVRFGAFALKVRETPGHTEGCISFVRDDQAMAFTGDALLIRGCGRTDFQGGSASTLFRSLREQILSLPDHCRLYPGHDYSGRTVTTVAEERAFNARIGGAADQRDFVLYMDNLGLPHPRMIDVAVPANLRCGQPLEPEQTATWGPVIFRFSGIPEIDPEWVGEHRGSVHIVDVGEAGEFDQPPGHIQGAVHIPLSQLRARLDEIPRDRPVVTCCRSGRRSAQATVILREAGIRELANLKGGTLGWLDAGLPTVHRPVE